MKRFASIDFLRGTAILIMLILHVMDNILDIDMYFDNVNNVPIINLVMLAVLPFLGGLAGFFLMVSATGNMISMFKFLEKGKPVRELIIRQVMGGILLLFFAMLCEGLIGWRGSIGRTFHSLPNFNSTDFVNNMLSRWNHFETLHTIAWCIIVNGLVQGILSRKGGWKDIHILIKKYLILIVVVLALTEPIWRLVAWAVPGYPLAKNVLSGTPLSEPRIGTDPWQLVLISPFLAPLAASMEPIFPYLATSFIGSIIGIVLCQPAEKIPKNFIKKGLKIGFTMFIIGAIGIVLNILSVLEGGGFALAIRPIEQLPNHRHWFYDNPEYGQYIIPLAWLWQYLGLNGFALMFALIVIYLVEFRGKGVLFAKQTTFIRRFGFTAFTNYNNQWILWLIWAGIGLIITGKYYQQLNWAYSWLIAGLLILTYYIIDRLWEKIGYIGSIEWCIASLAYILIPVKRNKESESKAGKLKWYEHGKLDAKNGFYDADWQNIIIADESYHQNLRDSKILEKLSKICLQFPLFIPFGIFLIAGVHEAKKLEGANPHQKKAMIYTTLSAVITSVFLILCFTLTPKILGFSL